MATAYLCESLADYLMGKTFHIETDHKPIVPPLGTKALDEMPPRIQRLRMRLLRFDFTISHVPGKEHTTADALSRTPSKSTSRHFIEISVLLASQKVKRYAHQSPYSLDTEYPISSGLTRATIGLDGIRRALKGLLVHTCDVKPKAAASQWRGGASRTLKKNALKKEKDPAKALVSYKATPLENGYSPAQILILFGRKIRNTVPVFPDQLKSTWPGLQELCEHKQESEIVQTNVIM